LTGRGRVRAKMPPGGWLLILRKGGSAEGGRGAVLQALELTPGPSHPGPSHPGPSVPPPAVSPPAVSPPAGRLTPFRRPECPGPLHFCSIPMRGCGCRSHGGPPTPMLSLLALADPVPLCRSAQFCHDSLHACFGNGSPLNLSCFARGWLAQPGLPVVVYPGPVLGRQPAPECMYLQRLSLLREQAGSIRTGYELSLSG
jgi:hypothetical protein